MAKRLKDTDYLFLSAYIHAKEPKLIGKTSLERMLDSINAESALKVVEESWQLKFDVEGMVTADLEPLLAKRRDDIFTDMSKLAPDPSIVDAFRVKYDYHNAKVLVKARGAGVQGGSLLVGSGRVTPEKLNKAFTESNFRDLPEKLGTAIVEAVEVLAKTTDPQLSDFVLDKAYFEEFTQFAKNSRSEFLKGYVQLSIDAANLRSAVRSIRASQELEAALIEGGTVDVKRISKADPDVMLNLFKGTELRPALDTAKDALSGGTLTEFELIVDNILLAYLAQSRKSGFSEKPLIGYIGAIENEISAVRTVLTGRFEGLDPAIIKSRLRKGFN